MLSFGNHTFPASIKETDMLCAKNITAIISEEFRIIVCNQAFANFVERSKEEIENTFFENLVIEQENFKVSELLENALSGRPENEYLSFATPSNHKKIGNVSFVPYYEDNRIAGLYCFIKDVSYRVKQNRNTFDNEQRLKTIFETEPECVKIVSVEGLLIDINPAGLKMLEVEDKMPVIGGDVCSMVHKDDRERYMQLHRQTCNGEGGTLQFRMYSSKGKMRWMDTNTAPLSNTNNEIYAVLSITRDITASKNAALLLEQSENRFRALLQNGSDIISVLNKENEYIYVTPSVETILGGQPDFYLGKKIFSFIHSSDVDNIKNAFSKINAHTHTELPLYQVKNKEGKWRWIQTKAIDLSDDPAINGIVLNSRDITEIKEAEIRILQSEHRFKSLVSNGSDIILIIDEKANFQYVSGNVTIILGLEPEFLIGKNAFDFIHKDDLANVYEELKKVIDRDDSVLGVQHRFLNSKGEWVWLESKGVNHVADPGIRGIIINAREVTDRIKLQQKLDEEVACKQKQITAAVIETQERERSQLGLELHDNVNQVLTTIKLYNEMLLEGMGDQKDILSRSVKHLQNCIDEIRSISKRLSAPTLGKISLAESIKELINSVNLTHRLIIQYSIEGLDKLPISQDLHLAIYRIIQEQLNNILKYASAKLVIIKLRPLKSGLSLTITDDGIGFDINKKSLGIGITNMTSRAEHMGGVLKIESTPGAGCKLSVKFPGI